MDGKVLFKKVQAFLNDKKPELDALIVDTDKFITDICKDLDIPIWEKKGSGETHTEEYLIIRGYLEYRLAGEIQYRMVFISLGADIIS